MNLVVATIPEDPTELADWLERRLVGLELDGLVAELTAIHRPTTSGLTVRELLGPKLDQVRESGLACLSREQIRHLLTRPSLLLDLQEEVLSKGGTYWDQLAHTLPMVYLKVEQGRKRLPGAESASRPTARPALPAREPWYRQTWLACLATAAAVLVVAGTWIMTRPAPTTTAWGWQRPGAIQDDVSASAYLDNLADGADQWFKKKPEDAQALA